MLEVYLFGDGDFVTAVGAFQQLGKIRQDLTAAQEAYISNDANSDLHRALAAGALKLRDRAAYIYAPVDTGSLRSAHASYINELGPGEMVGVVYLNPDVINPIAHKKPAVYGMDLIRNKAGYDWPQKTINAYGDEVLDDIADIAVSTFMKIFAGQ